MEMWEAQWMRDAGSGQHLPAGRPLTIVGMDEVGRGPLAGPVVAGAFLLHHPAPQKKHQQRLLQHFRWLRKLGVTDSKKLKAQQRQKILQKLNLTVPSFPLQSSGQYLTRGLSYTFSSDGVGDDGWVGQLCIAACSIHAIHKHNIYWASLMGMEQATAGCLRGISRVVGGVGGSDNFPFEKIFCLVDGKARPFGIKCSKAIKQLVPQWEIFPIIKGDQKSVLIGLASILAKETRDTHMMKLGRRFPGYGLEKHMGYPTPEHRQAVSEKGPTSIHRIGWV
jgi:ribonuclease HII